MDNVSTLNQFATEAPGKAYFWGTDYQQFGKIWTEDSWIRTRNYSEATLLKCYKNILKDLQYKTIISAKKADKYHLPAALENWFKSTFDFVLPEIVSRSVDPIDQTEKFIFAHAQQNYEAVLISSKNRLTLCLSSQSGCKLACRFCATGYMGFRGNLKAYEIVGQYVQILRAKKKEDPQFSIDNLVFMGMGEPLDNFNELVKSIAFLSETNGLRFPLRKISVSTSGLLPELVALRSLFKVRLIISLHSLKDDVRSQMMPINRKYSIPEIIKTLEQINLQEDEKITLSYMLLMGVNDQSDDLELLIKFSKKFPVKINLLPYHRIPHDGAKNLVPSSEENIQYFKQKLLEQNIPTFYRVSKGEHINAACGMLNTR